MENSNEQINALVERFGLSHTVKEAIIQISKDAYITGHNSCYQILKEHGKLKD